MIEPKRKHHITLIQLMLVSILALLSFLLPENARASYLLGLIAALMLYNLSIELFMRRRKNW